MIKCQCGSMEFTRHLPTSGIWVEIVSGNTAGNYVRALESSTDGLRHGKQPKYIKCVDCGKRAPNPDSTQQKKGD